MSNVELFYGLILKQKTCWWNLYTRLIRIFISGDLFTIKTIIIHQNLAINSWFRPSIWFSSRFMTKIWRLVKLIWEFYRFLMPKQVVSIVKILRTSWRPEGYFCKYFFLKRLKLEWWHWKSLFRTSLKAH